MAEPAPDKGSDERWWGPINHRNALLIIGVLAIQLGFIASYLGAFHNPKPHRIPIAVVAPPGTPPQRVAQAVGQLNALPGDPLDARAVPDEAAAREEIGARNVYGAFLPAASGPDRLLVDSAASASVSQAVNEVFGQVEASQHRELVAVDIIPAGKGDARGLSAFYLSVGWMLGGYLVATALSIGVSARPRHRAGATLRLGALAVYAIVSGVLGAVITVSILGAINGHFLSLAALGTLLVFASGAFAMGLQAWAGTLGVALTVVILVVLGNPSAGGAYAFPLLPPFWRAIGPWLPPGAATSALRGIAYFHGAGVAGPAWVLAGYAIAGSLAVLGAGARATRRKNAGVAPSGEVRGGKASTHE
jgi:hypothetical protein